MKLEFGACKGRALREEDASGTHDLLSIKIKRSGTSYAAVLAK
jgi:hypothetical protein